MKTRKYEHGVTLVEMLIVAAVIAILATMVVGLATRMDSQAREKGVESIFALLAGALQEYHEFTDAFPEQPEKNFANAAAHSEYLYDELHSVPSSRNILGKISDSLIKHNFDPGVVPPVPEIYDPWGTTLDYIYVLGDQFPVLLSAGPDRNFGTDDDMSNR
jgi:prepilin-type N-terminal cleavage/methylation domain-containing protein